MTMTPANFTLAWDTLHGGNSPGFPTIAQLLSTAWRRPAFGWSRSAFAGAGGPIASGAPGGAPAAQEIGFISCQGASQLAIGVITSFATVGQVGYIRALWGTDRDWNTPNNPNDAVPQGWIAESYATPGAGPTIDGVAYEQVTLAPMLWAFSGSSNTTTIEQISAEAAVPTTPALGNMIYLPAVAHLLRLEARLSLASTGRDTIWAYVWQQDTAQAPGR